MLKKISIAVSTLITTLAVVQPAQASSLINGGFEDVTIEGAIGNLSNSTNEHRLTDPNGKGWAWVDESLVTGWQTETADGYIEVWNRNFAQKQNRQHDDTNPYFPEFNKYFIELNANSVSSVFQDVSNIAAGQEVGFEFSHRGRGGTDEMNFTLTDLGADNIFGTEDDTQLFTKDYSAGTEEWERHTNAGENAIMTLGNTMRFEYSAVSTGSGNPTVGNFIDNARFGVGVGAVNSPADVPEPATILGLLAFGTLGATSLKRNKK